MGDEKSSEQCPACRGSCGDAVPCETVVCCGSPLGCNTCSGPDIQYSESWAACQLCGGSGAVDRVTAVAYVLEA